MIPDCDGRADGRTVGQNLSQLIQRFAQLAMLTRCKNYRLCHLQWFIGRNFSHVRCSNDSLTVIGSDWHTVWREPLVGANCSSTSSRPIAVNVIMTAVEKRTPVLRYASVNTANWQRGSILMDSAYPRRRLLLLTLTQVGSTAVKNTSASSIFFNLLS